MCWRCRETHLHPLVKASQGEDWQWGVGVAAGYQRELEKAFAKFVAGLRAQVGTGALDDGALEQLAAEWLAEWERVASDAIVRGGRRGFADLGGSGKLKNPDALLRDNPFTTEWLKTRGSELITEVTEQVKLTVRAVIRQAHTDGWTIPEQSKRIRDVVGLHSRQERAVQAYYDRLVAHGADDVEKKIARYADQLHRQRGELIARTETMSALNAGTTASWHVAEDAGLVPAGTEKEWVAGRTDRTCPQCAGLFGKRVPLKAKFPGGYVAPPAHPGCRCRQVLAPPSDW